MTEMTPLQALLTGAIVGSLWKAEPFEIDVELLADDLGNYLPEIKVTGKNSGEVIRVKIESPDASPDTVRDWDLIEMAVKNTIGNSDRVNGLAALKRLRGDEKKA